MIRNNFLVEVSNRFQALSKTEDIEEEWNALVENIKTPAEKTVAALKREGERKWTTDMILGKMDERRRNKEMTLDIWN